MQMVTGGVTAGTHVTDQLSLLHIITLIDYIVIHVGVKAGKAVAVVDHDVIAVGIVQAPGRGHGTGTAGVNGCSAAVGEVHTVMPSAGTVSVGTGDHHIGA